jgi:hypothetical protein
MTDASERYDDWEKVAEVGQIYEAELIVLRLREAGLDAQVLDKGGSDPFPIPASSDFEVIRVLVPRAQAEEARRVLAQPTSLPEDGESEAAPAETEETRK